jgi:hypothetical protein
VAEWSNAPDSKSGVRFQRTVGSNPTLSATNRSADHRKPPPNHSKAPPDGAFLCAKLRR